MNTIIYIYRGKDNTNFIIEKLNEREYCLIRLGLPVLLWKNLKLLDKEEQDKLSGDVAEQDKPSSGVSQEQQVQESDQYPAEKRKRRKRRNTSFFRGKKSRFYKQRRVQEPLIQQSVRDEAQKQDTKCRESAVQQVTALVGELEMLQTALCLLGGNTYWTYTVYEERLRLKIDTLTWWDAWKIPEFENYSQSLWAEKIMPYGDYPDYLILGQSDCIPGVLVSNARKIRSAKWYLLRKDYTEAVEEFIDNFYEEYGLAIEVHLMEERQDWRRVSFSCREPVKVLDFSGEPKVSIQGVIKGSVWLDMDAMDAKAERMEVRNQGIKYFSLKKLWQGLQKPSMTLTPM